MAAPLVKPEGRLRAAIHDFLVAAWESRGCRPAPACAGMTGWQCPWVNLSASWSYTQALFSASLPSHPDEQREEIILPNEAPSPLNPPSGCHFHPRRPRAMAHCAHEAPVLREVEGRRVSCHPFDSPSQM